MIAYDVSPVAMFSTEESIDTTTLGSSGVKAKPGFARPVKEAKPSGMPDNCSCSLFKPVFGNLSWGFDFEGVGAPCVHVVCRNLALPCIL